MVLFIFLPFYVWGGNRTLDFLKYHSEGGVQLESTCSSFLLLLNYLGLPVHVEHSFGAFNLVSPFARFFITISPILVICIVGWICLRFIKVIKFQSLEVNYSSSSVARLNFAQSTPEVFIMLVVVTLLGAVAASKVFSPQYILWVIPLFALLPYSYKRVRISGISFIATCLCTFPIFPYLYFTEFVHHGTKLPDGSILWGAPSMLATDILLIRNVLLIATTLTLLSASTQLAEKV
jgi:hypothetical protein